MTVLGLACAAAAFSAAALAGITDSRRGRFLHGSPCFPSRPALSASFRRKWTKKKERQGGFRIRADKYTYSFPSAPWSVYPCVNRYVQTLLGSRRIFAVRTCTCSIQCTLSHLLGHLVLHERHPTKTEVCTLRRYKTLPALCPLAVFFTRLDFLGRWENGREKIDGRWNVRKGRGEGTKNRDR